MPKASLSTGAVVDLALRIVDDRGPAALTLSAVAAEAGVSTPSLYKHVRDLAEVKARVSAAVVGELADRAGAAVMGRAGDDAIRALLTEWRAYVKEHPHRYAAMIQSPEPRSAEAGARLLGVLNASVHGLDLDETQAVHVARCLRSAVHGFVSLESAGGFGMPVDLDESFELLVTMATAGLRVALAENAGG
jgi:AcrR family transcriptional regulator